LRRELKSIKKQLEAKSRAVGVIKAIYPFLSDMDSKTLIIYLGLDSDSELIEFADYLSDNRDINHSMDSHREYICNCTDREGYSKVLYRSFRQAQRAKDYILSAYKNRVSIYPCPYRVGWHLSSY